MKRPRLWEKWLSFLWPIQIPFSSNVSQEVQVTLINGKWSVQTASANYSFDSLQRLLEKGLYAIPDLNSKSPGLILGLGAGSVLHSLRHKFGYTHEIVGVELDPIMIQIAEEYFALKDFENTSIELQDAYEFLKKNQKEWGLIVVDIFIHDEIPSFISSLDFLNLLKKSLVNEGYILFNLGFKQDDFSARQREKIIFYFSAFGDLTVRHMTGLEGISELFLVGKTAK